MRKTDSIEKVSNDYFDSIFSRSNYLTKSEYESNAGELDFYFGNYLPADKDAQMLDIGCGTGHFLYYLEKKGYKNFLGIDISESQVKFCRDNITANVEVADAFKFLADKINNYSVISANDVIEHIPKERVISFLTLTFLALIPNGILLLKLPNMSNPFSIDIRYKDFTHECGFTEKSIYQVLYVAGFRDIKVYPSFFSGKSIKSYIISKLISLLHFILKKLFWYQGFTAPQILSSRLIVIARKAEDAL